MTNEVAQTEAEIQTTQETPMFLSDQMEAYLNVFDSVIGEYTGKCIDARELYTVLGVKNDFTHWMKDRINSEDLVEKID